MAFQRKHPALTADTVVVATALTLRRPWSLLTSDFEDLRLLLAGHDVRSKPPATTPSTTRPWHSESGGELQSAGACSGILEERPAPILTHAGGYVCVGSIVKPKFSMGF